MKTYDALPIVESVIAALKNYPGRPHSDFYVGITDDPDRRLMNHNLARKNCL